MKSSTAIGSWLSRLPRGRLARGTLATLAVKAAAMPITLLFQLLLVRILGPAPYGEFIYAYSWYAGLLPLAGFGLQEATVRFVAEYRQREDALSLSRYRRWAVRNGLASALIICGIGFAAVYAVGDRISTDLSWTLKIVALVLPIGTLASIHQMILRGSERYVASQAPQQILQPLVVIATVAGSVLVLGFTPGAPIAAVGLAAGALTFLFVSRGLAGAPPSSAHDLSASASEKREWVDASLHFVGLALVSLLAYVDVFLLGALVGTTEAGIYGTVVQLYVLVGFGFNTVVVVIAPRISALHAANKREELQEMVRLAVGGSAAVASAVTLVFVVAGRPILSFFDPSFESGLPALLVLTGAGLFHVFTGPVGRLLTMTGMHREAFRWMLFAAVLKMSLNLVLIPNFGMTGAAAAMCVATVAWKTPAVAHVYRRLGVDPSLLSWLRRRGW